MAIMRRVSMLAIGAVFALGHMGAQSAEEEEPLSAEERAEKRQLDAQIRSWQIVPKRRDEPLRYLNISDYEVREIQLVAEKYLPKVLLNISPVVTGCPCEEGPQCTDQVYIVAETAQSSKGLQLSRVRNSWVVGTVQQWFLRYDELRSREDKMGYLNFMRARNELYRDFPVCVGELVPAENTTAVTSKADSKK